MRRGVRRDQRPPPLFAAIAAAEDGYDSDPTETKVSPGPRDQPDNADERLDAGDECRQQ